MHPLSSRPAYNDEQLAQILAAFTPRISLSNLRTDIATSPLQALALLQRGTAALSPWGNLALHYSVHRTISLDPAALFQKIVVRRHGGYCMENNAFLSNVLRGLGFKLYVTGARISYAVDGAVETADDGQGGGGVARAREAFAGWQHEVLIVTVGEKQYLVDIGFGAQGALEPLELHEGALAKGVPGITQRLVKRPIAQFTHSQSQKLWVVEYHTQKTEEDKAPTTADEKGANWNPGYCFAEQEWLEADFEIINYRTSTDHASWFTYKLVLSKALLDEAGNQGVGIVTLVGDEVARRMGVGGGREVLRKCKTEAERVDALERWFGIVLEPDERRGVRGTAVEIK